MAATKTEKDQHYRDFSNRKPYNDIPLKEGEVLVPITMEVEEIKPGQSMKKVIAMQREAFIYHGANPHNLETWHYGRLPILVGFAPIPAEKFEQGMEAFNFEVDGVLHPLARQANELSLEGMQEQQAEEGRTPYDPTGSTEEEKKRLFFVALNDLFQYYQDQGEPEKAECIKMFAAGFKKGEIAQKVKPDLQKSSAYTFVRKTRKEGLKLMKEDFMIM